MCIQVVFGSIQWCFQYYSVVFRCIQLVYPSISITTGTTWPPSLLPRRSVALLAPPFLPFASHACRLPWRMPLHARRLPSHCPCFACKPARLSSLTLVYIQKNRIHAHSAVVSAETLGTPESGAIADRTHLGDGYCDGGASLRRSLAGLFDATRTCICDSHGRTPADGGWCDQGRRRGGYLLV